MTIFIEVTLLNDNQGISFHDLQLFHAGCTHGELNKHRNPMTGAYTLQCGCGLEIEILDGAGAKAQIIRTAIDGQSRSLSDSGFSSNQGNVITISPRSTN